MERMVAEMAVRLREVRQGRRTRVFAVLLAVAMGIGLALSLPAPAVHAQDGTVRAQHGDWQVVCKPPPPGAKNEACALCRVSPPENANTAA